MPMRWPTCSVPTFKRLGRIENRSADGKLKCEEANRRKASVELFNGDLCLAFVSRRRGEARIERFQ